MAVTLRTVKQAVADVLTSELGADFGSLDLKTLDTDAVPQRLRGTTAPFWNLTSSGFEDAPAAFGGGSRVKQVFRTYLLALEGWWGIRGTEERTEEWDALVETTANLLETHNITVARAVDDQHGGHLEMERVAARNLGIVRVTDGAAAYRAHHAVIECRARVFLTLER